jgi:hypothetical protein
MPTSQRTHCTLYYMLDAKLFVQPQSVPHKESDWVTHSTSIIHREIYSYAAFHNRILNILVFLSCSSKFKSDSQHVTAVLYSLAFFTVLNTQNSRWNLAVRTMKVLNLSRSVTVNRSAGYSVSTAADINTTAFVVPSWRTVAYRIVLRSAGQPNWQIIVSVNTITRATLLQGL